MAAQLVHDSPPDAVWDCSLRTAEAAALLILSLRGMASALPEWTDFEILLDLAQQNGVVLLVLPSLLENGAKVPTFFTNAACHSRASAQTLATDLGVLLSGFIYSQRVEWFTRKF